MITGACVLRRRFLGKIPAQTPLPSLSWEETWLLTYTLLPLCRFWDCASDCEAAAGPTSLDKVSRIMKSSATNAVSCLYYTVTMASEAFV